MPGRHRHGTALMDALAALPHDHGSRRLTFAEIETLLGGPLPAIAHLAAFWMHSSTAHTNGRRRGVAARLDRGPAVTFTRQTKRPVSVPRPPR